MSTTTSTAATDRRPHLSSRSGFVKRVLAALTLAGASTAATAQEGPAMEAAVRDLCGRRVAMLGEASHGDGATFSFKVALIQRLVDECGYNAVLFEASHYDFLELTRRMDAGEEATPAQLSSAIGGLWNRYAELAPLMGFLFDRARSGRLVLGGLDDNPGSAGAFFSLDEMPARLAAYLPEARRAPCRESMRRRIHYSYPSDAPYDETERTRLRACLSEIDAAAGDSAFTGQLLANFERYVARDFIDDAAVRPARDRNLFLNLEFYAARLGAEAKIIVWAHNVHVARDAAASATFGEGDNLGAYVRSAWGDEAFSLGFTAYGGTWRKIPFRQVERALPAAPSASLEAVAIGRGDAETAYLGHDRLAELGSLPARPFNYEFAEADWSRVFDAMIVFRTEQAPRLLP